MKVPRRTFLQLAAGAARATGRLARCMAARVSEASGADDRAAAGGVFS